jgi:hypothetical protein
MERRIWLEVVAIGKMDDYKAWSEARDKRSQELGLPRTKTYLVQGRTQRMVCVVGPELTPGEFQQWLAKYRADERIQELERERREKKMMVDGATEVLLLSEV